MNMNKPHKPSKAVLANVERFHAAMERGMPTHVPDGLKVWMIMDAPMPAVAQMKLRAAIPEVVDCAPQVAPKVVVYKFELDGVPFIVGQAGGSVVNGTPRVTLIGDVTLSVVAGILNDIKSSGALNIVEFKDSKSPDPAEFRARLIRRLRDVAPTPWSAVCILGDLSGALDGALTQAIIPAVALESYAMAIKGAHTV
jgi:hypothetical protein